MPEETLLGPDDAVQGRPFADPAHTRREASSLGVLLERERAHARAWVQDDHGPREVVIRGHDEEGHAYLLVVPDTRALLEARDLTVVGFFGRPRTDVDHDILFELERQLVDDMGSYVEAGLLSYYDVELVKDAYGNLILFSTPEVPRAWHDNPIHLRAIELAPRHYHEIRLHKGFLPGHLLDGGMIGIERTRYLDYVRGDPWRAVRSFAPPLAVETRG